MRYFRFIATCIVLGASTASYGSDSDSITLLHHEPLQRLTLRSADDAKGENFSAEAPVILSFDGLGQSFDLELQPNANLLLASRKGAEGAVPYRGVLANQPGSWARITIKDGVPSGIVWDGSQLLAVEDQGVDGSAAPIIYRLADLTIPPGKLGCGAVSAAANGATYYKSVVRDVEAMAAGAVSEIDIGAVSDAAFTSSKSDPAAAIVNRMNIVDGIFSQQLGVQINVPLIEVYTSVDDPFTGETDPSNLLVELAQYRAASSAQGNMGLTHLWTGRNLNGSTVGNAIEGGLCNPTFGVGLSQGGSSPTMDALIAAHEIGHNFGAPHDGESGSACESTPSGFLMWPIITSDDQFSTCSIAQMQDDVTSASCITSLAGVDIGVALNGAPPSVPLGDTETVSFDVTNSGSESASNVVADLTLPSNISLVSAVSSIGTCASGAGTVNCTIGSIAGSSAATITLTIEATAVGTGALGISVAADSDVDPANNQASANITVTAAAVDLVINSPTARQVTLNQSTSFSAMLENVSALDATGVTLSVVLAAGLRVDSASWSIGSCTNTAQRIDCTSSLFPAQSSATIDVGVTGIATGTQSFTVTLSSTETDSDPSNNSGTGSVTVNAPSGGGGSGGDTGGGGGGAMGASGLLLLAFGAVLRRRRLWRR